MKTVGIQVSSGRIFVLALIVRAWYWMLHPVSGVLVGDAFEYDWYARSLIDTGRYLGPQGEAATRMPGYPLFLAAVRLLTGGSLNALLAIQCVLGALTCLLLVKLARRVVSEQWALLCGVAAAFYYDLIITASAPLSECLYSFFLVLSVWALYRPDWKPLHRALAFGALSGCLYLIRPEPLPYVLMTCAFLPLLFPQFGRKEVVASLSALTLVTGLWVGRNALVFHRLLPASSVGQNVKYLSLLLPAEQQGLAPEGRYTAPASLSELDREADMARAYRRLADRLTWPQIVKSYLFNLFSILYPFLPGYDWTYVCLLPFFLLGLREAALRMELRPMAASVLLSIAIFIFFGGPASRYRQGVSPFIVLLGVVGMQALYDKYGRARFRSWAGGWVGANVLVWLFSARVREMALWAKGALWRH